MAEIKASIVDFIKGLKGEPTGNPEDNMTEEQKAEYHREANRFNNGDGTGTITRKLTNDEIRKYSNQANEAGRAIAYKEMAFALEKRAPWIAEKTYGKDNLAQMHKDYDGDVARRKEANDILKKGSIDVKVKIGTDGKVAGEIQADGSVTAVQPATSKAYQAGQSVRGAIGKVGGKFKGFGADVDRYIKEASAQFGIPEDVMRGFVKMEGGWTGAMSPTGAIGTGQFVKGTWDDLADTRDGKNIGMTKIGSRFRTAQDPRYDKRVNTLATALLAKKNAEILRKNGVAVTGENLYMMHNIGGGIIPALKGSNNVSASTRRAMDLNGGRGKSAVEFVAYQM